MKTYKISLRSGGFFHVSASTYGRGACNGKALLVFSGDIKDGQNVVIMADLVLSVTEEL